MPAATPWESSRPGRRYGSPSVSTTARSGLSSHLRWRRRKRRGSSHPSTRSLTHYSLMAWLAGPGFKRPKGPGLNLDVSVAASAPAGEGAHAIGRDDEDLARCQSRVGRPDVAHRELVDEREPLVVADLRDPAADREAAPRIGGIDDREPPPGVDSERPGSCTTPWVNSSGCARRRSPPTWRGSRLSHPPRSATRGQARSCAAGKQAPQGSPAWLTSTARRYPFRRQSARSASMEPGQRLNDEAIESPADGSRNCRTTAAAGTKTGVRLLHTSLRPRLV